MFERDLKFEITGPNYTRGKRLTQELENPNSSPKWNTSQGFVKTRSTKTRRVHDAPSNP